MTPVRFPFDEKKALEALVFVTKTWPAVSAFFASKVIFLADKRHLNTFGRPVVGDRYIAMDNGPVPSTIYDWFKGNFERMGDPEAIVDAIEFAQQGHHTIASAKRDPDLSVLSKTDIAALTEAIDFCQKHSFSELSRHT